MRKLHVIPLFLFIITSGFTDKVTIEEYIRLETANLEKLIKKSKWVSGTVYFDNDSLQTHLLQYRNRDEVNYYLFCVAKICEDSIRVFTAKDVQGYRIANDHYRCYCNEGAFYFIHKLDEGKITLFERKYIPGDKQFLYYMNLPGYDNFFVVNPLEKSISEQQLPEASNPSYQMAARTHFVSNRIHEKFKLFVIRYLGDCNSVCNKVSSGFYTIYDIPSIVETYNQCNE